MKNNPGIDERILKREAANIAKDLIPSFRDTLKIAKWLNSFLPFSVWWFKASKIPQQQFRNAKGLFEGGKSGIGNKSGGNNGSGGTGGNGGNGNISINRGSGWAAFKKSLFALAVLPITAAGYAYCEYRGNQENVLKEFASRRAWQRSILGFGVNPDDLNTPEWIFWDYMLSETLSNRFTFHIDKPIKIGEKEIMKPGYYNWTLGEFGFNPGSLPKAKNFLAEFMNSVSTGRNLYGQEIAPTGDPMDYIRHYGGMFKPEIRKWYYDFEKGKQEGLTPGEAKIRATTKLVDPGRIIALRGRAEDEAEKTIERNIRHMKNLKRNYEEKGRQKDAGIMEKRIDSLEKILNKNRGLNENEPSFLGEDSFGIGRELKAIDKALRF